MAASALLCPALCYSPTEGACVIKALATGLGSMCVCVCVCVHAQMCMLKFFKAICA